VVGGAAIGMGAGLSINAIGATIKGERIDAKDLVVDATIGTLAGGVGGGMLLEFVIIISLVIIYHLSLYL
jgi:hypothetical protein